MYKLPSNIRKQLSTILKENVSLEEDLTFADTILDLCECFTTNIVNLIDLKNTQTDFDFGIMLGTKALSISMQLVDITCEHYKDFCETVSLAFLYDKVIIPELQRVFKITAELNI